MEDIKLYLSIFFLFFFIAKNEDKCLVAQKFTKCLIDYVKFYIKQFMYSFHSNSTSEEERNNNFPWSNHYKIN